MTDMYMYKDKFIDEVAEATGATKKSVREVINAYHDAIIKHVLDEGYTYSVPGFGKFVQRRTLPRSGKAFGGKEYTSNGKKRIALVPSSKCVVKL